MRTVLHEDRASALAACGFDGAFELARGRHREASNLQTELETPGFGLPKCVWAASVPFRRIPEDSHLRYSRKRLFKEFESFAAEFGDHATQPGDISSGSREVRDHPRGERIGDVREYDLNAIRYLFCGEG